MSTYHSIIYQAKAIAAIVKNRVAFRQLLQPKSIPVIIINFNQLFYLQKLIDFLLQRRFQNIVVIDNASTYPPLLEYYNQIAHKVTIEKLDTNDGHMVFFKNDEMFAKYGRGFYIVTDADIEPNPLLPRNFMSTLIHTLIKYSLVSNKVGFALDISNIPPTFPLKERVVNWEKRFWEKRLEKNKYLAEIDTTFALYRPGYRDLLPARFLLGVRIAGNFTAKHGGWYVDPDNFTDEQLYYIKKTDKSSSWKLNEAGESDSKSHLKYEVR